MHKWTHCFGATISSKDIFLFSDPGFTFTEKVHPICLPVESNTNPFKWNEENVEVLGFATQDLSGTRAESMKVANVFVFTQDKCNSVLEEKLHISTLCKYFSKTIYITYFR